MLPLHTHMYQSRQAGLGLVEIMVGMLIGILGMMAMMQVLALSETQRRNSQAGGDTQSNGMIALFDLQREITQAGYGIGSRDLLGCSLLLPNGTNLTNLAPLTINHPQIPAGDANTDTLLIVTGSTNGATEGDRINGVTGSTYVVGTPTSFRMNDWVVAARENTASPRVTTCALSLVRVTAAPGSDVPVTSTNTSMAQGRLFNLGLSVSLMAYAIRDSQLVRCDFTTQDCTNDDAANWTPIASNIVSLRAQYGVDAATPVVSSVPSPAPSYSASVYNEATPTNECGWLRTLAVRFVLVARSPQRDGAVVTAAAPDWYASVAGNPTGSTATPINLSARSDWQHYRYKAFQTVTPLRNINWMGVVSGC